MKQTVNFYDFETAFRNMEKDSHFSYEGLYALFEYLEDYEENIGEEIELNVIALCGEYNEETIEDVLRNYNLESIDELEDLTTVIRNDGETVLYQTF